MSDIIQGKVYVLGDNIDTDQIIPAQHLSLVPTIPEEYMRLGGYALSGLPPSEYPTRLVEGERAPSDYVVLIAGRNFGCGSSREHAPIALGAAGIKAVVAESFARIYFRNCISTGELYPIECKTRLIEIFKTGDRIEIDLSARTLRNPDAGEPYTLEPLGEVEAVISAGGLFAYARKTGLISTKVPVS